MRIKDIRVGIIGTNFVSDWFFDACKAVKGISVTAVCSRTEEKGREFAKRHKIKNVFTDYKQMLSSDIDAVYVATPSYLHCNHALMAISKGKHVLVEKIIAVSYAQVLRMRTAAEKAGVVLLEAMRPDFDPATDAIRESLSLVGKIRRARLEYCQYSSRYDAFKQGDVQNAFNPLICNSALADIGVYPLHIAVSLFGKPETVQPSCVMLDNGFEALGSIRLVYPEMLCDVVYSKITESATPSVVEGEDGSLIFDRINGTSEITFIPRSKDEKPRKIKFTRVEKNMTCEIAAFRDMIRGERDNTPYLDISIETVRLATDALRITGAVRNMPPDLLN